MHLYLGRMRLWRGEWSGQSLGRGQLTFINLIYCYKLLGQQLLAKYTQLLQARIYHNKTITCLLLQPYRYSKQKMDHMQIQRQPKQIKLKPRQPLVRVTTLVPSPRSPGKDNSKADSVGPKAHTFLRPHFVINSVYGIDLISNNIQKPGMIIRDRDYYMCQGAVEQPQPQQSPKQPEQEIIEARGNIRERLAEIKSRIETLKRQKNESTSRNNGLKLSQLFEQHSHSPQEFTLSLEIPEELLKIQQRIERLEAKASGYEIYRQRTERKGTVVDRVKRLQKKLEELLKAKSIEVVTENILKYNSSLEQREQNMKQLYLYEVYTRTQGMSEELNVLEHYLTNLSKVQRVVNSAVPVGTLVANHNEILSRKQALQTRIQLLYNSMRSQYRQLIEEIEAIEI